MLAKVAEAGKNMPSIPECLEMFREHVESKTYEVNATIVCAEAPRFSAGLKERRTLSEVTPVDISGFLDRMTALGRPDSRNVETPIELFDDTTRNESHFSSGS